MSFEQLHSKYGGFYAPAFEVKIDGQKITKSHGIITSVSVDATMDGADHFSLSVDGTFDFDERTFEGFDWETFPIGGNVAIEVGYGEELESVFVGSINAIKPSFPADGPPSVEISGYGRQHELTKNTNSASWEEKTDSEAAQDVIDRYDFDDTVDSTSIPHRNIVQDDQTDAAFLEQLAKRNDEGNGPFEVFARRDEFYFRAPRDDREPSMTLRYGPSLQSFSPEYSDATQVQEVEVRHYDPATGEQITGSASQDEGSGKRVVSVPVRSREEADNEAKALLNRQSTRQLSGQGETVGIPELDVGETIEIEGLGERFSKVYYVEQVTHRVDNSGYTTSFSVRLPDGGWSA